MKIEYKKFIKKYIPNYVLRRGVSVLNFIMCSYYRIRLYPLIIRYGTSDIGIFEQIFVQKDYDITYDINPKLIIDGGANVGYASIFFAEKFPEAEIYSIEPENSNFEVLKKNTSKYHLIHPIKGGLWPKKGYLKIIDREHNKSGFMTREVDSSEDYDIEVITIGDILNMTKHKEIDILKLDMEGAEKELFSKNSDSWLGKVNIIIIELHDRMKEGCSEAFYSAIKKYKFKQEMSGENIILRKIK